MGLKINIEKEDDSLIGMDIKKNKKVLLWHNMTLEEKDELLNMLVSAYKFFNRCYEQDLAKQQMNDSHAED